MSLEIQFDKAKWMQDSDGVWLTLRVKAPTVARKFVAAMKEKLYVAKLMEYRQKRSLDANAYTWVLCQKISEAVGNITKEDVYRQAVRQCGPFDIVPIRDEAVDDFIARWRTQGLGWFAEIEDESKLEGFTRIIMYYGSSTYNTQEMSVLLDNIITEAQELGIETKTPDELAAMKAGWGSAQTNKST